VIRDLTVVIFASDSASADSAGERASQIAEFVVKVKTGPAGDCPFEGRFDAMYNCGIRAVTKGWVLLLHSDEEVRDKSVKKISQLIQANRGQAFSCSIVPNSPQSSVARNHIRLWKSEPDVRFIGAVAPTLFGVEVQLADIEIFEGKSLSAEERVCRDESLLRLAIQADPLDLDSEIRLYAILRESKADEAASLRASICQKLATQDDSLSQLSLRMLAQVLIDELDDLSVRNDYGRELNQLIRFCWKHCAQSSEVLWAIAQVELKRGDILSAFHTWRELIQLVDSKKLPAVLSSGPAIAGAPLFRNYAQAAIHLGRRQDARWAIDRVLKLSPNDTAARLMRESIQ